MCGTDVSAFIRLQQVQQLLVIFWSLQFSEGHATAEGGTTGDDKVGLRYHTGILPRYIWCLKARDKVPGCSEDAQATMVLTRREVVMTTSCWELDASDANFTDLRQGGRRS